MGVAHSSQSNSSRNAIFVDRWSKEHTDIDSLTGTESKCLIWPQVSSQESKQESKLTQIQRMKQCIQHLLENGSLS